MTAKEIIEKVKGLGLRQDQYIVFGSAPMALVGLREVNDIDMVVRPEIMRQLKEAGWKQVTKGTRDKPLTHDVFDVHDNWNFDSYQPTLDELLSRAVVQDGVAFASLEDVRRWKEAAGRPKDLADLELIHAYFSRTSSTTAKNAFIFHGTGGFPEENWFPWLKNELEIRNVRTIVPQFPTPQGQSLRAWLNVMAAHNEQVSTDTILVGHSLGGLFLLRYLEQLNHPVRASFFIAASAGVKPIKFYEAESAFSGGFDFDWAKIRGNAGDVSVFHSDDDPYVSVGNGEKIAEILQANLRVIPISGHFNTASGYTKFPQLLKEIEHVR